MSRLLGLAIFLGGLVLLFIGIVVDIFLIKFVYKIWKRWRNKNEKN